MAQLDDFWPLYRLRLRVGEIELRLPDEADLAALAELSSEPIHDPTHMPFTVPWSDQPGPARARSTIQWSWRARAEWTPANWRLGLVAVHGDKVVVSRTCMDQSSRLPGKWTRAPGSAADSKATG